MSNKIFFLFLLTFSIIHTTSSLAEVRFVSKTGSSTPPYTSWETAADSIQKCINISQFGDTIYVANGVYKEQVIMISGLSLIGAGTDSCIVDTRDFAAGDFRTVTVVDSCILQGFYILCTTQPNYGRGIYCEGRNSLIIFNKISSANSGINIGLDALVKVYDNTCLSNRIGISIYNSHLSIIRNNFISSIEHGTGISIGGFNSNYVPIIDSNFIEVNRGNGIRKSFGSSPVITNNIIYIKHAATGISLDSSDSSKVVNNLIIVTQGVSIAIDNSGVPNLQLYNNYVMGNAGTGISVGGSPNIVKNNVVTNSATGIEKWGTQPNPFVQYNNVWNSTITNYSGFTADTTNLSVDPMIVNDDTTQGELDFHLQKYSPLINAGDPTMMDKDSSRIDIGLYGGLFGEVYNYQDLAPRPPRNVFAILDSAMITVKWNRNTEADFNEYKLFRDTVGDFTADSATLILSLTDTSYSHLTPPKVDAYYYKLTAVDSQGNESNVSDEIAVKLTSIDEYPMIVSDYRLYQNYPNPFNPSTTIAYRLKESGYVKLYVYDIKGEQIAVLVNQYQAGGYYEVEFNMEVGSRQSAIGNLASGVYIYQLMVKSDSDIPVFSDIKKMLIIK